MLTYILRRILYAVPILLGVNVLIFGLFFFVNTPDDMAETVLGEKRVTQEQKDDWKRQHNYHLPYFVNAEERGGAVLTQTIFWQKSMRLFVFDFGKSDTVEGKSIGDEIRSRIPNSLAMTVPIFLASLCVNMFFAMIVAFYRGTYIDNSMRIICVIMMSIAGMFYIIGAQTVGAQMLRLVPISGFDAGLYKLKFLILPVVVGLFMSFGGSVRYYRTVFLEEINKDYVRTARAKGLSENVVLFKHALKNAMIPVLTNVVVGIPFLIMGSLMLENFFSIPGLGGYMIEAIGKQDFAVVRSMAFLGSVLYIIALIFVDISYTLVDPRVRLK